MRVAGGAGVKVPALAVGAKGAASSLRPDAGFRPAGSVDRSIVFSIEPADPVTGVRPITIIVRCWEPTRPRTVRAVWDARGGRCYSQLPASVDAYLGASLGFGKIPVGPLRVEEALPDQGDAELSAADADPPRCACCALEEPVPRRSDL
jgi:hypothetical protein